MNIDRYYGSNMNTEVIYMIGKKMLEALNKQVNEELYSSYLYLAMSADFADKNLEGFASWLRIQAKEEVAHAMKIYGHIQERGGKVILDAVGKPPHIWKTAEKAFQDAYDHERHITARINELMELAVKEKDYPTIVMLQWFVKEQVEEEASAEAVLNKIKLLGEEGRHLYILDREMGKREKD